MFEQKAVVAVGGVLVGLWVSFYERPFVSVPGIFFFFFFWVLSFQFFLGPVSKIEQELITARKGKSSENRCF